jgi:peroxin-12
MYLVLKRELTKIISTPPKEIAGNASLSRSPLTLLRTKILPLLTSSLSLILPTSIFLLKFLEWWSSSSLSRRLMSSTAQSLDLPAPSLPKGKPYTDSTCPLCKSVMVTPTAVLESGYVFCYKCIFSYIEEKGCCPMTHIKILSGTEGLRRIRI